MLIDSRVRLVGLDLVGTDRPEHVTVDVSPLDDGLEEFGYTVRDDIEVVSGLVESLNAVGYVLEYIEFVKDVD